MTGLRLTTLVSTVALTAAAAARPVWAEWIAAELTRGRDVYAYFNNDVGGAAVRDAATLMEI
jgi:uncharacterized protein YecE (DUF72 family)